jgi:hypothetical protein
MPDDMALYFASEIPGADRRLFVVRRPGPGMPFGAPNPLSELNIGLSQSDPWVSRDERVIYFRSGFSIYRASR